MKLLIKLAIAIVAIIIILQFSLGSIIKTAINEAGPGILGAPVSVEKVSFSPLTGSMDIKNLIVGNPKGFKSENAFTLGSISIDIDMLSLLTDTIRIPYIIIDSPQITFEKQLKTSNLAALQKASASSAEPAPASNSQATAQTATDDSGKKLEIDLIELRGAQVTLIIAGGMGIPVPLPPLKITDIGKDGNGATLPEILDKVLGSIVSAVSQLNFSDVLNNAGDQLKGAFDSLKNLF